MDKSILHNIIAKEDLFKCDFVTVIDDKYCTKLTWKEVDQGIPLTNVYITIANVKAGELCTLINDSAKINIEINE